MEFCDLRFCLDHDVLYLEKPHSTYRIQLRKKWLFRLKTEATFCPVVPCTLALSTAEIKELGLLIFHLPLPTLVYPALCPRRPTSDGDNGVRGRRGQIIHSLLTPHSRGVLPGRSVSSPLPSLMPPFSKCLRGWQSHIPRPSLLGLLSAHSKSLLCGQ